VLLGLALAGIRLGLARRGRPSAGGMVASAPPPDLDAGGHSASDPSVGDPLAGDSSVADPVLEQHGP
jgi:hypothetical protein